MNIVRVSCALLCLAFLGNCIDSPRWIDSLTEYIGARTNARQVMLMSNLAPNERTESRIIDELFVKIAQNIPTVRMNIVIDPSDLQDTPPDIKIEDHSGVGDTSTTFFIFVHESREILGYLPSPRIIDFLLEMSVWKNRSKFLFVLVSPALRDEGFEDLLELAWTKKLLDFTLVELTNVRPPAKLIGFDYSKVRASPVIHQLNLFRKEYTRKNWTSMLEWFPDKVRNMWAHPLKVGVSHHPPFSWTIFDEYYKPVRIGGANIRLLKIIARMLNFTIDYQLRLDSFMEINVDATPNGVFKLMRSGKVDIMAHLSPHLTTNIMDNTMRTAMIRLDKLCPLIAVLPRSKMPFPTNFFKAYLASFAIIALFWILKRALRFRGRVWQPFNLLRVLFGVSVTRQPKKITECILFACLLFVSAIYSSNIYVALTHISLQATAELEFETFEDIEHSGFTPIMSTYFYNRTYDHADPPLARLKKKTVIRPTGMYRCPLMAATYKNITCIMMYQEAKVWVRKFDQRSGGKIKITKPCFWADSTGFLVALRSPYRARINEVLGRIQSSGLLEKLYNDRNIDFLSGSHIESPEEKAGLDINENMESLRKQLLAIFVVGYTASLLTLVAEILVDRALKFKRRNVKQNFL